MCLAFGGSIGMAFVILACALKQYNLWWPFFVVLFYILAVLPRFIVSNITDGSNSTSLRDASIFFTTGSILSSFALPIVLAHSSVIMSGACYLTIAGNIVIYVTLAAYFIVTQSDSDNYIGGY